MRTEPPADPPCRDMNELFFSVDEEDQALAVEICTGCDQRRQCPRVRR